MTLKKPTQMNPQFLLASFSVFSGQPLFRAALLPPGASGSRQPCAWGSDLQALALPGPHVYHAQTANSTRLPTPSVLMTITGVA